LTINSENISNRLTVRVTPNAGRNEIIAFSGGVLQVRIAAPPVKGKANKELTDFLSKTLGVRKSSISIIKGQTSRNKVIAIEGMNREDIIKRLSLQVLGEKGKRGLRPS
jgi:uncharacterized protein (TIGR00251 family)